MRQEKFAYSHYFKTIDKLVVVFLFSLIAIPVVISIKIILFPQTPISFISLVSLSSPWRNFLLPLVAIIYQYFCTCIALSLSYLIIHLTLCFPMIVIIMANELRPGLNEQTYYLRNGIRKLEYLPLFYRQVELLINIGMNVYALMIIHVEGLLTFVIVACNCSFILYNNEMSRLQTVHAVNLLFIVWSVILGFYEIGGRFDAYSRRTLASWKRYPWNGTTKEVKVMKRFIRSCRALKVGYKGYRKIRRTTVLVIMKSVAVNTFRAVKMLKT